MWQWGQMTKELNVALLDFGQATLPTVVAGIKGVTGALRALGAIPEGAKKVLAWAIALGGGAAAVGGGAFLAKGALLRFAADKALLKSLVPAAEAVGGGGAGAVAAGAAGGVAEVVAAAAGRARPVFPGFGGVDPNVVPSRFGLQSVGQFTAAESLAQRLGQGRRQGFGEVASNVLRSRAASLGEMGADVASAAVDVSAARMARWDKTMKGMFPTFRRWASEARGSAEVSKTAWNSWEVALQGGAPRVKALFTKAGWATMGTNIATGFKSAALAVKNFGVGLAAWLISPVGIVVASLAVMVALVVRTVNMALQARAAEKAAEKADVDWKAAQKASQDAGNISQRQIARRLGFTDEQFDKGLSREDSARVNAEYLQAMARRRASS